MGELCIGDGHNYPVADGKRELVVVLGLCFWVSRLDERVFHRIGGGKKDVLRGGMITDAKFIAMALLEISAKAFEPQRFVDLSDLVSEHYGLVYTDMAYSVRIGEKAKTKEYRYKPKNLQRLLSVDPNAFDGASFESLKEIRDFTDTNLSLDLQLPTFDIEQAFVESVPVRARVIIDPASLTGRNPDTDMMVFVEQLENEEYEVISGVGFFMDKEKLPAYFVAGIGTSRLTDEEGNVADALTLNKRQFRTKIWDIFLHNVVRKEFLDEEMVQQIRGVVSDGNVQDLGDKYLISLPVEDREYLEEEEKTSYYKNELRQVFQSRDRIMFRQEE